MIHSITAAKVVTNVLSSNANTYGDKPVIEWSPSNYYNPVVQEGATFGPTIGYPTRYLLDTDPAFTFSLNLDRPAKGGEQITVTETVDNQGFAETTPDMDYVAKLPGTQTITFKPGQQQADLTVTPIVADQGYQPRRLIYTLSAAKGLDINPAYDTFIVVVHTQFQHPIISVTSMPAGNLAVGSAPSAFIQLKIAEPSTPTNPKHDIYVYMRCFDNDNTLATYNDDITETVFGVKLIKFKIPKGTNFTGFIEFTAVEGVVQSGNPYSGNSPSSPVRFELAHESYTKAFDHDTVDPFTQNYGRTINVGVDQNLWHWTNDIVDVGYENDNKGLVDHGGVRYGMPAAYPTPGLPDGASYASEQAARVDTFEQAATGSDIVRDPETGNPIKYAVPSDTVTNGTIYLRESFAQVYCGGPLTGYPLQRWVYAAMRIEPFSATDNVLLDTIRNVANDDTNFKRTRQAVYFRCGYRCRTANRNHGVSFEWRNCATGKTPFGDQTPASTTLTFDASNYAQINNNCLAFIDDAGVRKKFAIPTTAGGSYTGSQSGVIVWDGALPTSAAETADAFVSMVNAQSGYSMTARRVGNALVLTHDAAKPLIKWLTYVSYQLDNQTQVRAALGISGSPPGQRFTVSSIVDNGGQNCAPGVTSGTGELPGSPLVLDGTGQYYYDSVTGCEIWFLKRYNLWNPDYAANGTVTRPSGVSSGDMLYEGSHNGWGKWYGVTRDSSGLVAYVHNYIPADKPAASYSDQYCYAWDLTSTGPKTGLSANTRIGYNTWPPTSGNRVGADGAAAEESSGSLIDGYTGWELSKPDADAFKGNSIQYPLWSNSSDRSNGEPGFRPYGVNTIRTHKIGMLWHSQQFQMSLQNTSAYDDPAWGPGPHEFFPNNSVTRWPRGGGHDTATPITISKVMP